MTNIRFLKLLCAGVFICAQVTASPAQTLTTLLDFNSTDGAYPYASMVQGRDGNFYGTTYSGGTYGDGTVFRVTAAGTITILHQFNGADGSQPYGAWCKLGTAIFMEQLYGAAIAPHAAPAAEQSSRLLPTVLLPRWYFSIWPTGLYRMAD